MIHGQQYSDHPDSDIKIRLEAEYDKLVQTVFSGEDYPTPENTMLRRVLDLSEMQIRQGLIKLGWTPPGHCVELGMLNGNAILEDISLDPDDIQIRVGHTLAMELKAGNPDSFRMLREVLEYLEHQDIHRN